MSILTAIEAAATRIFAANGLPSVVGHYRRPIGAQDWELISEVLTPAQKFDLVLQEPEAARYQYAALDRLGEKHPSPDVRMAAALLAACQGIRLRIEAHEAPTAQNLADALRMGIVYTQLASSHPDMVTEDLLALASQPMVETEDLPNRSLETED